MSDEDFAEYEPKHKRKNSKRGAKVPLEDLGFKAKVYPNTYLQAMTIKRKKPTRAEDQIDPELRKKCFMARLVLCVDNNEVDTAQLSKFIGTKRSEWFLIKQVVYRAKKNLHCCICLQNNIDAPQMTFCGHVFCWVCIYMHQFKSLKGANCPVCNQSLMLSELRSCKIVDTVRNVENAITFELKLRRQDEETIYTKDGLLEDLQCNRIARLTTKAILQIYEQEYAGISARIARCNSKGEQELKEWLIKVLSLSGEKVSLITSRLGKERIQSGEVVVDGFVCRRIEENPRQEIYRFYQQNTGRLVFMHPICQRYLRKYVKELPRILTSKIILTEETVYGQENYRGIRQLNHLSRLQSIDLIIIDLQQLLLKETHQQFEKEVKEYQQKKLAAMKREEKQAQRLQLVYEQEMEYKRTMEKMQSGEFYDIRLPKVLDLSEVANEEYFPSLIGAQVKSEGAQQTTLKQKRSEEGMKFGASKDRQDIQTSKVLIKEEQFPGLCPVKATLQETQQIAIQIIQTPILSQPPHPQLQEVIVPTAMDNPPFKRIRGKRRKQKFVDVTSEFMRNTANEQ